MIILQVPIPELPQSAGQGTISMQFALMGLMSLQIIGAIVSHWLYEKRHARERREAKEDAAEIKAAADALKTEVVQTKEVATTAVQKIEENTQLTHAAVETSKEAINVANGFNQKIITIGERRNEMFEAMLQKVVMGEKKEN